MPVNNRTFASDNNATVHPAILQAITEANVGHVVSYGDDKYTEMVQRTFQENFGKNIAVQFVFGGTGANVMALKALAQSYNAVIAAESAHLQIDECAAPENYIGCKVIPIPTKDGKLAVNLIKTRMYGIGDVHRAQPKVITITQATEEGTVYTLEEIQAITEYAHEHNLYVHMDGARLANAAVSLDTTLKELTANAGIDVLSFGGTKNGMMYGNAVVFFKPELAKDFRYIIKQGMQLPDKTRFIAVQFDALLSNDLWRKNALHANKMAKLLEQGIVDIPQVKITQKVQSNAVFASIPKEAILPLQKRYFFYEWNEAISEVRWMTSWDTTEEDVNTFISEIKQALQ